MFKSYSMSTTRGPDGEIIKTTTIRDQDGTRTTVTKNGEVIEGSPEDLPDFGGPGGNMFGPGGDMGMFSSVFGRMFGDIFQDRDFQPRQITDNQPYRAPPRGSRESIFSDDFLAKEQ